LGVSVPSLSVFFVIFTPVYFIKKTKNNFPDELELTLYDPTISLNIYHTMNKQSTGNARQYNKKGSAHVYADPFKSDLFV
jgi:hypothetical protein